jgi:hypothetical protein
MRPLLVVVDRVTLWVAHLREGNSATGDKNINSSTNDGSFNMDDMKNSLHGLGGDGANGVIGMRKK